MSTINFLESQTFIILTLLRNTIQTMESGDVFIMIKESITNMMWKNQLYQRQQRKDFWSLLSNSPGTPKFRTELTNLNAWGNCTVNISFIKVKKKEYQTTNLLMNSMHSICLISLLLITNSLHRSHLCLK